MTEDIEKFFSFSWSHCISLASLELETYTKLALSLTEVPPASNFTTAGSCSAVNCTHSLVYLFYPHLLECSKVVLVTESYMQVDFPYPTNLTVDRNLFPRVNLLLKLQLY